MLQWNKRSFKYIYHELASLTFAYAVAMSLTFWFTRFIKFYCAWPRPDFWERCFPEFSFSSDDTYDSIQTFEGFV